jgi:Uma2 family endonuclease
LIDKDEIHIEYYRRTDKDEWILHDYNDINQTLVIHSIDFQISLTDIYAEVELG